MRVSPRSPLTLAAAAGIVAAATVSCGAGAGAGAGAGQAARQATSPTSTTAVGAAAGPWHVTATSPVGAPQNVTGADTSSLAIGLDRSTKSTVVVTAGGVLPLPTPKDYSWGGEYFAGSAVGPPALDGKGKGVYVVQAPSSPDYDYSLSLFGMTIGQGGGRQLTTRASFPQFASDGSGNAILVWSEYRAFNEEDYSSLYDIRVSIRRSGHGFGKPITLGPGGDPYLGNNGPHGNAVTAAIGGGGRIVVVGMSHGIQAWTGTVAKGFSKTPIRIGGAKAFGEAFTAGLGAKGRAFVAWGQQASGEDPDNPWVVKASSIAPGARKAAAVHVVDAGAVAFPVAFPKLVADADGRALLAWSAVGKGDRGPYPVRTISIGADGRYGTVETLADSGALTGLAVASTGSAIVTWQSLSDTEQPSSYVGSVRPARDAKFGAAEGVPIPFVNDAPVPGFDFEGRPVLAYSVPNTSGTRGVTVSLLTRDKP